MVLPARLLEPQDGETKDVVLWVREAAEEAALREYEKRQLGLIFTLGFPPVVISVGLDSNGVPAFSVTLNDGTNTTPTAVATAANTATAAPAATTQAPAATTAAVPGTSVGTNSAINTGLCKWWSYLPHTSSASLDYIKPLFPAHHSCLFLSHGPHIHHVF